MLVARTFDVGGVLLDRPFKVRRLGHFGVNVMDSTSVAGFYTRVLGFRVSDTIDFAGMLRPEQRDERHDDGLGYFMRHGTDHHSYVVFPKPAFEAATMPNPPGVTANQLTWQVGSLEEVRAATDWFPTLDLAVVRAGRDMPGSNWHVYVPDPDGHVNELYYGIEQIGWSGHTKPAAMYERIFHSAPDLPQVSEADEVTAAIRAGIEVVAGHRHVEVDPATFDVQGVLLPRPFKIVRIGPVCLFVSDMAASVDFYSTVMGLRETERATHEGFECVYLRADAEHHSLALWPLGLRTVLGLSEHTTLGPIGLQVANYRQLKAAVAHLQDAGFTVRQLPPVLHPGVDYAACVRDPDGHTLQLYYCMEQVGWSGAPRPASFRPRVVPGVWPDAVAAHDAAYAGEPFLGPWG
jgi:catechol 2,3-dioxygenase-like lactoylglutathione lyase family enzyme